MLKFKIRHSGRCRSARLTPWVAALLALCLWAGPAWAYRPFGWIWQNWPYVYDTNDGNWYYFSTGDAFWVYAPSPGPGWERLGTTELVSGWAFYSWPYAYDAETKYWSYLNEGDSQWCLNLSNGIWSRFGQFPPREPGPAALQDFDGDGRSDFTTFERAIGFWRILPREGEPLRTLALGGPNTTPVSGDFDGDGIADPAVFNTFTAIWSIIQSSNTQLVQIAFGDPDLFPVPADYDGDGITDLATYSRQTGDWWIRESTTGNVRTDNMGGPLYRPVPADYDGDGRADLAVFLAAFGQWVIRESGSGKTTSLQLGNNRTIPVPGRYDGDRRADPAVYEPALSRWTIQESLTGLRRTYIIGGGDAVPVAGDFDGDGRQDIAVYRPSIGRWQVRQSRDGVYVSTAFGVESRRAVAAYALGAVEDLRIHCHGDSITYGVSSSSGGPSTGYPIRMERNLEGDYGGDIVALNYGVSGETTGRGRLRLPDQLAASRARVLLIMEGTNDHFYKVPFSDIENNLRDMVQTGLSRGLYVVIATIPPVLASKRPDQQQRIQSFNPRIYNIARDFGIPVAPVYEFITGVPGWENTLMDAKSANHPNDAGYEYVRAAFIYALTPALDAAALR